MAHRVRFFAVLSLLACVSPLFGQEVRSSGKAVVYFYQQRALVEKLRTLPFYIDNVEVARVPDRRYFRVTLKPGKHVFRCNTTGGRTPEEIEVRLEANGEYYLRAELVQLSMARSYWHIVPTTRNKARLTFNASSHSSLRKCADNLDRGAVGIRSPRNG